MSDGAVVSPPPGSTSNFLNPAYIGYQLVVVSISSAAFSGLFLGLRLYNRKYIVRSLGWDDWWIVCAWLSGVALTTASCIETRYGAGVHLSDLIPPTVEMFLKVQLVLGSTYIAALAFAKVSICCFYLRLSPDHTFRLMIYLMIAFTASFSFAGFLIIMFSCNPVSANWDPKLAIMPTASNCINRQATYIAQAGLNILTDILIILLPLPTIWKLALPFRQKLTVSSVFAVGIFVIIISTIRLGYVAKYNPGDLTWDSNAVFIWTTIEAHLTIICACVATLKPFINRFFPKLLGRPQSGSVYNANDCRQNTSTPSLDPAKRARLAKHSSNGHHHHHFRFSNAYSDSSANGETRAFSLRGYRERVMGKSQHKAVVTSGPMARRPECHEGSSDSQRGMVNGMEHDMAELKNGGVFVTRTVHVS